VQAKAAGLPGEQSDMKYPEAQRETVKARITNPESWYVPINRRELQRTRL
jgi:hypothetical protein